MELFIIYIYINSQHNNYNKGYFIQNLHFWKNAMPENKVTKYFSLIEAWAWCEICSEMVNIRVNKDEIKSGLKIFEVVVLSCKNIQTKPTAPAKIISFEFMIYIFLF